MKSFETYIGEHRQDMINALRMLVQHPSVRGASLSGAPFGQPAADALQAYLQLAGEAGLRTHNMDGYVGVAEWGDEPALGILSHLDVVPAGDGWTFPPFDLTERDGWLYGRGVIDDKGPTVAALFALRAVIECGVPLKRGVRLIVGCAEETGSEDIAYYAEREAFPPMLFTPDAEFPVISIEKGRAFPTLTATFDKADAPCAVTEVVADGVVNAVPGVATARLRGFKLDDLCPLAAAFSAQPGHPALTLAPCGDEIEVTARGVAAHASTPESGVNALTGLLAWLTTLPLTETPASAALGALTRLFPHGETDGTAAGVACRDDESGALTLVFSRLRFSETELTAEADIRFPVCRTLAEVSAAVTNAAASAGMVAQVEGVEPHHVPADSPFVQTLLDVYEQVTGERGEPLAIGGGTYVHGTPGGVAFGAEFPGDDNRMHGADERLSLARFEQMTLIYAHAIANLCG